MSVQDITHHTKPKLAAYFKSKVGKIGTRLKIEHGPAEIKAAAGSREDIYDNILKVRPRWGEEQKAHYDDAKKAMAFVTP